MPACIVIPARYASTRFPGKPLALIAGRTMIQRVYERSRRSVASAVYVATDDDRIAEHVRSFGGAVVMPVGDFRTGTDRIAASIDEIEAGEQRSFDVVVNVQGDEPLIEPSAIDSLITALEGSESADMATLSCRFDSDEEYLSPDVVKVVTDLRGDALYFSRAPIPHRSRTAARRHVGLYGYRATALRRLAALAQTDLEVAESLEQLRALQNGLKIRVLETDKPHLGVDRPEDVARVERELAKNE